MKKVGYVFNHEKIIGGGELSFIGLIDRIRDFDVEPIAMVPGSGEVCQRLDALSVQNIVVSFPPLLGFGIRGLRKRIHELAGTFLEMNLDVVHANGARCMLYAGPAARRAKVPCVWHVRVLDRDHILDRIRSRYADMIIANSLAVSASLQAVLGQKKQADVIYNGIEIDRFQTAAARDLHRELGVPEGPVVLGVGRFTRWKKFEDLIRACSLLQKKSIHFSLVLLGEALPGEKEYEQELKQLAVQLGLHNVFFPGWCVDVAAIMKSANVLALPSHAEPFGRVILEAWACGLPVIACDAGGPAEIIRHQQDGLLTTPANVAELANNISLLLSDRYLADSLAKNGRRRAEEFSIEKHAENISRIYQR